MLQHLQLAGLKERTHESDLRAVRKFAQGLKKSPDQASENDLRRYLLFIKNDQQWEANFLKVAYSGLKSFYCHTCPREWPTLRKLRVPKQLKLPTVLTIPEVDQLIGAVRKPALHTWGRDWNYHPHMHFIVPRGALSKDGQQWLSSRAHFFVPVKAASKIYRAKFLDCLADSGLTDAPRHAAADTRKIARGGSWQ